MSYSSIKDIYPSRCVSLILTIFFISLFSFCFPHESHSSEEINNTLFLPLKINTPKPDNSTLTKKTDDELSASLLLFGIKLLPRTEASSLVDYTAWPPSYTSIQTIPHTIIDYIAVGSLTQYGNKLSIDVTVYDLLDETSVKLFFKEGAATDIQPIINALVQDIISYTNRQSIISNISVSGNKKIDTGAINQKINITNGSPYDRKTLRDAIKSIYKMGYFDDVTVRSTDSDLGKEIVFEVSEKDIISQIIIEGEDELEKDTILEVVEVSSNSIISDNDIKKSETNIKELYKQEGYHNTKVSSMVTNLKKGKVNVTFTIAEGVKVFIKEITITGNKAFSRKKLTKIMQTSTRGWFSWFTDSGVLNKDIIQQDAARLSSFYQDNGYIKVKIGEPVITQKEDWFHIQFNIDEGEQYRVGTVDLSGDLIDKKSLLLERVAIKNITYFSRKTLREDVLRITDYYAEKGFAFAEAYPQTVNDIDNKRVNIIINIDKRELVHINRIVVRGNSRTRDKVIRREMQIKESGIFNATALKNTQKRLERLGYFEDVKIDPEPTLESDKMDIIVNVKEKSTGNFSIGAGYSSVDSFMFMSEVSENNFLGKGQKMSLQANLSSISKQYNLSFTEPRLADSKLMAGFDLYNWTREYDDYDKESQGAGIRFGYPLKWRWKMFGGYSFDDTNLTNVRVNPSQVIQDSMRINLTSAIKLGFSRDTRNKRTDATTGTTYAFNVKYAGGPFGGDAQFTKFDASASHYKPLPWETVLHNKLAVGWAFANTTDKLPVFEKYYLGGINTIRGFQNTDISPIDPVTFEKIGGGKMWYYNLELIFPLVKDIGLKGLVFLDAGNVYEEDTSWDVGNFKKSAGLGFRWLSPMGPLRLEWGYNLDPTATESQSNWDFSMGGSF